MSRKTCNILVQLYSVEMLLLKIILIEWYRHINGIHEGKSLSTKIQFWWNNNSNNLSVDHTVLSRVTLLLFNRATAVSAKLNFYSESFSYRAIRHIWRVKAGRNAMCSCLQQFKFSFISSHTLCKEIIKVFLLPNDVINSTNY